jgi:hypothetical protein
MEKHNDRDIENVPISGNGNEINIKKVGRIRKDVIHLS